MNAPIVKKSPADEAASLLMEVVPMVMRRIRHEARGNPHHGLSVPQFRILNYLLRHEGATLSSLAEHAALGLPAMSRAVDALVDRELVQRDVLTTDRRFVSLKLTPHGQVTLKRAWRETEARLGQIVAELPASQQMDVINALQALRPLFASGPTDDSSSVGETGRGQER